jgi:hypothetical protein
LFTIPPVPDAKSAPSTVEDDLEKPLETNLSRDVWKLDFVDA